MLAKFLTGCNSDQDVVTILSKTWVQPYDQVLDNLYPQGGFNMF